MDYKKNIIFALFLSTCLFSQSVDYGFKYKNPVDVGIDQFYLNKIDSLIKSKIEKNEVAGTSAMIVKDGAIVYEKTFGLSDIETKKSLDKNTIFAIASMSKLMTSVGALILFDRGLFTMNTELSTILPEFSNPDIFISFNKKTGRFKTKKADKPILMRHLFTHTSGIVYPLFTEDEFGRQGYLRANIQEAYPDMSITLEQNIINLSKVPLMHEPGEGWTYGMNMDVLGRVIEVLDGRPFARFMKEELFDPLKLANTSFSLNESKWNNVSKIYSDNDGGELKLFECCPNYSEKELKNIPNLHGFSIDHYKKDVNKIAMGGADIMSTPYDYAKFLYMILNDGKIHNKQIISKKTSHLIYKPLETLFDAENQSTAMGLSVSVVIDESKIYSRESTGTFSWGGYFYTHYWADPKENLIGVIMSQVAPTESSLNNEFQHLVYSSLMK